MPKILAIDSSTEACSIALLFHQEIHEFYSVAPQQHTKLILPMIQQVLTENNLVLSQLDALAFSKGPGSFTGIRIAAGIIQGLAIGTNLPIIAVSTLQALAQSAFREKKLTRILASLDAHRNEIYWSAYRIENNQWHVEIKDELCHPENITLPIGDEWIGVGNAWKNYGEILKKQLGNKLNSTEPKIMPHAQDIATLARDLWMQGNYLSAEQAIPSYLRGKEAWKGNT